MNELKEHLQDKVKVVGQKAHEKKRLLLGKARPQKGQQLWQLNRANTEIKIADTDIVITGNNTTKRNLIVKANHMYCLAINYNNAVRKFIKMVENERKA